jgi:hypothetical protein
MADNTGLIVGVVAGIAFLSAIFMSMGKSGRALQVEQERRTGSESGGGTRRKRARSRRR